MNKWIAEFELEDGDTMPEHMDLEYKGVRIDFHCKPLEQEPTCSEIPTGSITKTCRSCKNFGSHHGICEICKDNKCWTEKEPTIKNDVPENNAENIYICSCGYGWDKSKVVRHHFCPNCGKAVEPATKNNLAVDCIDRQATLDAIITRLGISNESYLLPAERTIYQQIKDMPSVTPQESRWIPVSERLPEKGYSVLVTRIIDDNCKYVRIASYQGDCWMDNTDEFNKPNPHKVIAWQSLSPCYEPQESEVQE